MNTSRFMDLSAGSQSNGFINLTRPEDNHLTVDVGMGSKKEDIVPSYYFQPICPWVLHSF